MRKLLLTIVLTLLCAPVWAQSVFNVKSAGSNTVNGTMTQTYATNNTAGNGLIVGVVLNTGATNTATTVTDSAGDTFTACPSSPEIDSSNATTKSYIFVAYPAIGGANTVTLHLTGSGATSNVWVIGEVSGVSAMTCDQAAFGTSLNGTATSGSTGTLSSSSELVIGLIGRGTGTSTYTAGTGFTIPTNGQTTYGSTSLGLEYEFVSSTSPVTCTSTGGGGYNSTYCMTFNRIGVPTAATPTFGTAGGAFTAATSTSLSCTTLSSTIYYTTDGTTPTTSSPVYSSSIPIGQTKTVKAMCTASGYLNSPIASALYTLTVPTPSAFAPAASTYGLPQTVNFTCPTGASCYYAFNASPTCASTLYSGPIAVNYTETLEVIGCETGWTSSSVTTAAYTITVAVSTTSLPSGLVGVGYSQTLAVTGAKAPVSWAVTIGSLPTGLSLNASTGVISGSATTAGTSSFTVTATDAQGSSGSQSLGITTVVLNSQPMVSVTT